MAEQTKKHHIDTLLRKGPWARIIDGYVARYGNARCERWKDDLVYLEDGVPTPIAFDDKVLTGIARKAAVTLRGVCSVCGKKGKQRRVGFYMQVHCSECHGKFVLAREIDKLLNSLETTPVSAFNGLPGAWFWEQTHPHIRACVPAECWRKAELGDGTIVIYMTREDLRAIVPWLKRIELAMVGRLKNGDRAEEG